MKKPIELPQLPENIKQAIGLNVDQLADSIAQHYMAGNPINMTEIVAMIHKRIIEAATLGEMNAFMHEQQQAYMDAITSQSDGFSGSARKNKRNGYNTKTLKTNAGEFEVNIPRDRNGEFSPQFLPKHSRVMKDIDDKILALYGLGTSTRDIEGFVKETYGIDVSPSYISSVTDSILDDIKEWQNRPLERVYAIMYCDAIRIKIRDSGRIKSKAVNIIIGVNTEGLKSVLGLKIAENESAAEWGNFLTEIKNRGVEDVLLVCSDGLKGMTDAIEQVFPDAIHQTCIVHLIRNSCKYVSCKDRKDLCKALKEIYEAPNADEAERKLEEFEGSDLGKKYPQSVKVWRNAWQQVIPFFDFSKPVRKLIYTTNTIEGLNRCIRKVIKSSGSFPSDDAAKKLVYLAIRGVEKKWKRASTNWSAASIEFVRMFGDRFL